MLQHDLQKIKQSWKGMAKTSDDIVHLDPCQYDCHLENNHIRPQDTL